MSGDKARWLLSKESDRHSRRRKGRSNADRRRRYAPNGVVGRVVLSPAGPRGGRRGWNVGVVTSRSALAQLSRSRTLPARYVQRAPTPARLGTMWAVPHPRGHWYAVTQKTAMWVVRSSHVRPVPPQTIHTQAHSTQVHPLHTQTNRIQS